MFKLFWGKLLTGHIKSDIYVKIFELLINLVLFSIIGRIHVEKCVGQEHNYSERTHCISIWYVINCFLSHHLPLKIEDKLIESFVLSFVFYIATSTPLLLRTAMRVDTIWYGKARFMFKFLKFTAKIVPLEQWSYSNVHFVWEFIYFFNSVCLWNSIYFSFYFNLSVELIKVSLPNQRLLQCLNCWTGYQ